MHLTLPTRILALTAAGVLAGSASRAPAPRPAALDAGTAAALEALADGALEAQRAGAFETLAPLTEDELATLGAAQAGAPELADQRGGDINLTDREVQIVLWTALVIVVIVIVA